MTKKILFAAVLFAASNLLVSCSSGTETGSEPAGPPGPPRMEMEAGKASLSDPKASIAYQLELVKAGDTEKLKTCLTPRLRDSVTAEAVEKAKGEAGNYTIDDLYASAEMGEDGGKKTAKVKMKDGKTLTTLVETDGQWLSDTVWFK